MIIQYGSLRWNIGFALYLKDVQNLPLFNLFTMTALLILGPFLLVWVIAALFYSMGCRRAKQLRLDEISFAQSVHNRLGSLTISRPKTWLAVKSRNSEDVARSIGLVDPQPCANARGLTDADRDQIFVSHPVNGWVVVVGECLPNPDSDIDGCFKFLSDMSERLGHVQYFHCHQSLCHHAWVKLIDREVVRAYVWTGETVWNQGKVTIAEEKSGMKCFDYFVDDSDAYCNWEAVRRNMEQLPVLVSIWSVDPVVFCDMSTRGKPGWIGRLPVKRSKRY